MIPPDTLAITASGQKSMNLRVQIAGPFNPATLDSALKVYVPATQSFFVDSTRTRGSVSHSFSADYTKHDDVLGTATTPGATLPGIYVIRLSVPEDQEGFYRLGLRLHRKKRI